MFNRELIINFSYLVACIAFIVGLKMLHAPLHARKGNQISFMGMLLATAATFLDKGVFQALTIFSVLLLVGSLIGFIAAKRVPMTAMPEMVALLHGFGGLASLLVGWSIYHAHPDSNLFTTVDVYLSLLIGGVTFTGSMIAWAKLSENMPSKPIIFSYQNFFNGALLIGLLSLGTAFCLHLPHSYAYMIAIILGSFLLGTTMVLPIGGGDMPVVISLLNSYSGLAACMVGLVLKNNLLIVSGALVGANGVILSSIMCKAMNRSLKNILFSGFVQKVVQTSKEKKDLTTQSMTAEEAWQQLSQAKVVMIVPGYGLAVSQAQHALKELIEKLEKSQVDIKCAIHPVAGRMPGHMNVLLAEANIPYDRLQEMDEANPQMADVDVCLVIGANDVVNLSARDDKQSSIYGMPILEVDKAKQVFILKRSMKSGFAGIDNPLFYQNNTFMLFGDAKETLQNLVKQP
jgi:NAD(P) transhydrogenase subunit beta